LASFGDSCYCHSVRKADPALARNAFFAELSHLALFYDRVALALQQTPHKDGDVSTLAEITFLLAYVGFERFASQLFLAYINRDSISFQNAQIQRMQASLLSKFGLALGSLASFKQRPHILVSELMRLLDRDDRNVTFSDAAQMVLRATEW